MISRKVTASVMRRARYLLDKNLGVSRAFKGIIASCPTDSLQLPSNDHDNVISKNTETTTASATVRIQRLTPSDHLLEDSAIIKNPDSEPSLPLPLSNPTRCHSKTIPI